MTDGAYTGLTDPQILTALRTTSRADDGGGDHGAGDGQQPDDRSADGGDEPGGPDDGDNDGGAPDSGGAGDGVGLRRGAGIELRVRLTTLLGLDSAPAELAGWGPVHAELARDLTARLAAPGAARWRCALTDPDGHLAHSGVTVRRPATGQRRAARPARTRGRAVVELAVAAHELPDLAASLDPAHPWAPIIDDLAVQAARADDEDDSYAGDRDRRRPGAALRRHVQVRDRTCTFPTCRVPATRTDQDHTRDSALGGPTGPGNLAAACRHDHRLRTDGGWTLHHPTPGHLVWTSRLGHTYHIDPPRIIDQLPDPLPRDRPLAGAARPPRRPLPSWDDTHPEPPRPSPAPPAAPHDPPPF